MSHIPIWPEHTYQRKTTRSHSHDMNAAMLFDQAYQQAHPIGIRPSLVTSMASLDIHHSGASDADDESGEIRKEMKRDKIHAHGHGHGKGHGKGHTTQHVHKQTAHTKEKTYTKQTHTTHPKHKTTSRAIPSSQQKSTARRVIPRIEYEEEMINLTSQSPSPPSPSLIPTESPPSPSPLLLPPSPILPKRTLPRIRLPSSRNNNSLEQAAATLQSISTSTSTSNPFTPLEWDDDLFLSMDDDDDEEDEEEHDINTLTSLVQKWSAKRRKERQAREQMHEEKKDKKPVKSEPVTSQRIKTASPMKKTVIAHDITPIAIPSSHDTSMKTSPSQTHDELMSTDDECTERSMFSIEFDVNTGTRTLTGDDADEETPVPKQRTKGRHHIHESDDDDDDGSDDIEKENLLISTPILVPLRTKRIHHRKPLNVSQSVPMVTIHDLLKGME